MAASAEETAETEETEETGTIAAIAGTRTAGDSAAAGAAADRVAMENGKAHRSR